MIVSQQREGFLPDYSSNIWQTTRGCAVQCSYIIKFRSSASRVAQHLMNQASLKIILNIYVCATISPLLQVAIL
jgi:hypothetical protein